MTPPNPKEAEVVAMHNLFQQDTDNRYKGRLIAREECDQSGPRWDLARVDGETIARDLDEDTARRLAACWNRSEGFSTDLMAHPDAPRFMDQLWAISSMHNHSLYELKQAREEVQTLKEALAQAAPQAAQQDDFAAWLAREMPAGTVINDPAWWAPRILRAVGRASLPDVAMPEQMTRDEISRLIAYTADNEGFDTTTPEGVDALLHAVVDAVIERLAAQPAEGAAVVQAPAAPTDEQIIAALHACGIDTHPSKYGFEAVQVVGTSVPNLRNVFVKLFAAEGATQAGPDNLARTERAFRKYIEVMAHPCNEYMAEIIVCREQTARRAFAETIRTEAQRLLSAYPRIDGDKQGAQGDAKPEIDWGSFTAEQRAAFASGGA